jgi:hypothetical protein
MPIGFAQAQNCPHLSPTVCTPENPEPDRVRNAIKPALSMSRLPKPKFLLMFTYHDFLYLKTTNQKPET